jgi:hypothetical protein
MQSPALGSVAASLAVTYRGHMVKIIRLYLIVAGMAFVGAVVSPTANAAQSYESGETLMSLCEKPQDSSLYGFCAGYIIGTADVLDDGSFCPPEGHDKLQLVDVAVQWLGNNPENRQDPAHSLVAKALAESFPCS